jgi:hypothetical protein
MVAFCYHLSVPHYDPEEVRALAASSIARRLTRSALDGCLSLGMAPDVVWETLAGVDSAHCRFVKTIDSDRAPGEKLDVFDALVDGQPIYLKLKIVKSDGEPPRLLVILSFKRNEYYDRNLR